MSKYIASQAVYVIEARETVYCHGDYRDFWKPVGSAYADHQSAMAYRSDYQRLRGLKTEDLRITGMPVQRLNPDYREPEVEA